MGKSRFLGAEGEAVTLPGEMLRSLTPETITAWLDANGWELVETRVGHSATYRKPAGEEGDYLVDLPLRVTFRDYARRVGEVLDTLATASGKHVLYLLPELGISLPGRKDDE